MNEKMTCRSLVLLTTILSFTEAAVGQSFHDVLIAQPSSTWSKVNTNRYEDVWAERGRLAVPRFGQIQGRAKSIIGAWGSMAWDSNRGDLVIFGGGHANYNGNEVYRWRSSTREWERGSLPSDLVEVEPGFNIAFDGIYNAPASAHTYDNNEFLPHVDRFITFGGAAYNTGRFWEDETRTRKIGPYLWNPQLGHPDVVGGSDDSQARFDRYPNTSAGYMWENRDNLETASLDLPIYPGNTFSGFLHGTTAYVEEAGHDVILVHDALRLWKYSIDSADAPELDSFELVGREGEPSSGQGAGAYDPVNKLFVRSWGTRNTVNKFVVWDLNNPGPENRHTRISFNDVSGDFQLDELWLMGMDFDPVRDYFVLWDGTGKLWSLKPPASGGTTATWTIDTVSTGLTGTVPTMNKATTTGVLGKWKYIPEYDVFVGLYNSFSGDVWIYKPSNWSPTHSMNGDYSGPSATITSPSTDTIVNGVIQVNVDASDDVAVSEVHLYADGVLVDSDVSAPYTFFVDSTPMQTGYLVLRAEAVDSSGNTNFSDSVRTALIQSAPGEIIVDDLSPNTTRFGNWQTTLSLNPFAGGSVFSNFGNFTFHPELPAANTYDVYVWWTASSTHAAQVPILVNHDAGVTTIVVDHTDPAAAGRWNFLGTYALTPGVNGVIEIQAANGPISADAVRLVPNGTPPPPNDPPIAVMTATPTTGTAPLDVTFNAAGSSDPNGDPLTYAWTFGDGSSGIGIAPAHTYNGGGTFTASLTVSDNRGASDTVSQDIVVSGPIGEIIVDNLDSNTSSTGSWATSTGANPYEGNSVYNNAGNTFTWSPAVPEAGNYEVYAWWTTHPNRSSTVPYRVTHDGGTATIIVDQRSSLNGGRWNLLGVFALTPGSNGAVTVSSENGQASADAVRLVPTSVPPPPPGVVVVDNQDSNTSRTGVWLNSSGPSPFNGSSLYNDAGSTFSWSPGLATGDYEVYAWWTTHPNRTANVPYRISHDAGTTAVLSDQADPINAGRWNLLGTFTFTSGQNGTVTVSSENGQANADAVRFVPVNGP